MDSERDRATQEEEEEEEEGLLFTLLGGGGGGGFIDSQEVTEGESGVAAGKQVRAEGGAEGLREGAGAGHGTGEGWGVRAHNMIKCFFFTD